MSRGTKRIGEGEGEKKKKELLTRFRKNGQSEYEFRLKGYPVTASKKTD